MQKSSTPAEMLGWGPRPGATPQDRHTTSQRALKARHRAVNYYLLLINSGPKTISRFQRFEDLFGYSPGAPLAITFHAFSVKKPLITSPLVLSCSNC